MRRTKMKVETIRKISLSEHEREILKEAARIVEELLEQECSEDVCREVSEGLETLIYHEPWEQERDY
jgi:Trp operon repressor